MEVTNVAIRHSSKFQLQKFFAISMWVFDAKIFFWNYAKRLATITWSIWKHFSSSDFERYDNWIITESKISFVFWSNKNSTLFRNIHCANITIVVYLNDVLFILQHERLRFWRNYPQREVKESLSKKWDSKYEDRTTNTMILRIIITTCFCAMAYIHSHTYFIINV